MTHQTQIQKQLQKPAQASSKASEQTQPLQTYRIEASITNPENRSGFEGGNLHDSVTASTRAKASDSARQFWQAGYWVEVFENETNELLAGPIDPDKSLPSYIV